MPHKNPHTPFWTTYTWDHKELVIYQSKIPGKTITQIAIELDLQMKLRSVQHVLQTWDKIGEVCKDKKYKGRAPLMSEFSPSNLCVYWLLLLLQYMIALLEHSPDPYLDEIQDQLSKMHDIDISSATITWTLKRLSYSNKNVSLHSSKVGRHE